MSKEIIPASNTVPGTIKGIIDEVFSEAVLKKASAFIRQYESETDALLFSQGLIAIKKMLQHTDKLDLNIRSYEFSLIKDELNLHIQEVNAIILKVRGKRPLPPPSSSDIVIVSEIEQAFNSIFGTNHAISFENITPLLLEASKDEKTNIT